MRGEAFFVRQHVFQYQTFDKGADMKPIIRRRMAAVMVGGCALLLSIAAADEPKKPPTSYAPVVPSETFDATVKRMSAAKLEVMQRQLDLLKKRYDLSNSPAGGVTGSGRGGSAWIPPHPQSSGRSPGRRPRARGAGGP